MRTQHSEAKCNITTIGGGTGTFNVLSGLGKNPRLNLAAIVTVADSGGSTGELRDEFGILLPETDAAGAREVGERLLQAVRERRIEHDGHTLNITVSIGATALGPGDDSFESAFLRADRALYEAKHGGRDRIMISLSDNAAH